MGPLDRVGGGSGSGAGFLDGLTLRWAAGEQVDSGGALLGTGVMFRGPGDEWLTWDDSRFAAAGVMLIKVAGVSFRSGPPGASCCDVGERVRLVPEPDNPYDPNAIAVFDREGRSQAGYVPRDLTAAVRALGPPEAIAAIVFYEWRLGDGARSGLRCALGPEAFIARLEAFVKRGRRYASTS